MSPACADAQQCLRFLRFLRLTAETQAPRPCDCFATFATSRPTHHAETWLRFLRLAAETLASRRNRSRACAPTSPGYLIAERGVTVAQVADQSQALEPA